MLKKPTINPPIITIVGSPGTGKTSLGALFPAPVFIQAEESSTVFESWDVEVQPDVMDLLPRSDKRKNISTKDALLNQFRWLIANEHDRKTLVIDSVTSLNKLFEHELCEKYGVDNVADACGGFHKGYIAVSEMHAEIKNACDILRVRKGMTIVFLAHSGVKKMKNRPDSEEYTIYTLDMHDASITTYVNLVDGVFYIKNKEFVKGVEHAKNGTVTKFGKMVQSGDRVLITSGDGRMGYINAKNRYDLEPEIDLPKGENPLLNLIPFFTK